jgi:branched-chain amino acid transport system substrate-binding protein
MRKHTPMTRPKTHRHSTLLTLLAIVMLSAVPACSIPLTWPSRSTETPTPTPSNSARCTINIGIINSLSGRHINGGEEHSRGYMIALDEINNGEGVLGCDMELVIRDDQSTSLGARDAVTDLIEVENIPVILGAYSSAATLSASAIANDAGVPFIIPSASNNLLTSMGNKWVFRINSPSLDYVESAFTYLSNQADIYKTPRLAIVFENTAFGESAAVAASAKAEESGISVVTFTRLNPSTISDPRTSNDYRSTMQTVKDTNPHFILFAISSMDDAVGLLQQCKELDINPAAYIGTAGAFINANFPARAGEYGEYVLATTQWSPDAAWQDSLGRQADYFVEEFTYRFGVEPGSRSMQTYTTLHVVRHAIELAHQNGPLNWSDIPATRLKISNALNELYLEETLFGPIDFDVEGQNDHPILIVQIKNGRFVTVYPETVRAENAIIPAPLWRER